MAYFPYAELSMKFNTLSN